MWWRSKRESPAPRIVAMIRLSLKPPKCFGVMPHLSEPTETGQIMVACKKVKFGSPIWPLQVIGENLATVGVFRVLDDYWRSSQYFEVPGGKLP